MEDMKELFRYRAAAGCLENVLELSQNPVYQDVTLICDGGIYHVNSILITSMFPVFGQLLDSNNDEFIISVPDIEYHQISNLFSRIVNQESNIEIRNELFDLMNESVMNHEEISEEDYKDEILKNDMDISDHDYCTEVENLIVEISEDSKIDTEILRSQPDENTIKVEQCPVTLKYKCPLCEYSTNRADNFKRHVLIHEESKPRICKICKESYPMNLKKKHKCPGYRCNICGYSNRNLFTFNTHLKVHQKETIKCQICEKVFDSEKKIKRHMITHASDGQVFQCDQCGYRTLHKSNLKRHCEIKHERTAEKGFKKCKECRATFSEFENHKCVFYSCDECGKQFGSMHLVSCHKKTFHAEVGKYSCELCDKVFEKQYLLKKHLVFHNTQKVSCHICGLKFFSGYMRIHLKTHEEKETCKICNKAVQRLSDHMKTMHQTDDQKSYQCSDCGKGFVKNDALQTHYMNVHLKLRPWKCRYGCTFAYNDRSNRNAHERKTHGKLFDASAKDS